MKKKIRVKKKVILYIAKRAFKLWFLEGYSSKVLENKRSIVVEEYTTWFPVEFVVNQNRIKAEDLKRGKITIKDDYYKLKWWRLDP